MAAKSTLSNMALCLTLVCLVCAGVLGVVFSLTKGPIEDASLNALRESIGKVLPGGGEISEAEEAEFLGQKMEYYLSEKQDSVIAYAVKSQSMGFGGPIVIMVGVLPDGTVYNTSVLSHSETPGLGAKCTSDPVFLANWSYEQRQLSGKKLENITVSKDGGDVDAITASTITSRAYSLAVSNAVAFVKSLGGQNNE